MTIHAQHQFALSLLTRLNRHNLRAVADGKMRTEDAEAETEAMSSIVATLEKCVSLAEIGDEMAVRWRVREGVV